MTFLSGLDCKSMLIAAWSVPNSITRTSKSLFSSSVHLPVPFSTIVSLPISRRRKRTLISSRSTSKLRAEIYMRWVVRTVFLPFKIESTALTFFRQLVPSSSFLVR